MIKTSFRFLLQGLLFFFILLSLENMFVQAQEEKKGPVRIFAHPQEDPFAAGVGSLIESFDFTEIKGQKGSLMDYRLQTALIIAVRDVNCPVSKRYGPRLAELEKKYQTKNVTFLYLYLSRHDTLESIQKDKEMFGFQGKIIADPKGELGKKLKAKTTTEVFLIDSARTLRYRGAIDDQYGIGFSKPAPRYNYLEEALAEVMARNKVTLSFTNAPGCFLDLEIPQTPQKEITYHNRISRIIQKNCISCHRQGGAGPFPLETYQQVAGRKAMIRFVVKEKMMPPWFATPGSGPWINDRSLSVSEREDLINWAKSDATEGNPEEAPVPLKWESAWSIGKPDLIIKMKKPFLVPATGVLNYQYFYLQNPLTENRWIKAMQIRSRGSQVVHHVLILNEAPKQPGETKREYRRRFRGGIQGYFAAAVPGQTTTIYGKDFGKELPAKTWLKFQLHYTPNGQATMDQTEIGFVFHKTPPKNKILTNSAFTTDFTIPPYASNYKVKATYYFKETGRLISFAPHTHLRGKAFHYELLLPNGQRKELLDVPSYDFNWQLRYRLKEPILVPAGSRILATAWYDNSEKNPANPDASIPIDFGEQTWDEMMIGYFEWYKIKDF